VHRLAAAASASFPERGPFYRCAKDKLDYFGSFQYYSKEKRCSSRLSRFIRGFAITWRQHSLLRGSLRPREGF